MKSQNKKNIIVEKLGLLSKQFKRSGNILKTVGWIQLIIYFNINIYKFLLFSIFLKNNFKLINKVSHKIVDILDYKD